MLTTPDGPEGQEPKEEGWGAGNGADQDAGMEGVESEDLLGERRLSAGGSSGPLGDGVLLSPRGTADTVPAQAPPTPAGEGALLVHQLLAGLGQGGAATPADTAPATSLAAAPAPVRVSLPSVLGDPNPAPAAGGEGEDDAPYDPEGYNFSPSRGGAAAADTHTGMADGEYDPSGAHTAAGYDGGQDMGGPHVAHEPAEEEEAVKDLSPIVARPELGSRAAGLLPGELVRWVVQAVLEVVVSCRPRAVHAVLCGKGLKAWLHKDGNARMDGMTSHGFRMCPGMCKQVYASRLPARASSTQPARVVHSCSHACSQRVRSFIINQCTPTQRCNTRLSCGHNTRLNACKALCGPHYLSWPRHQPFMTCVHVVAWLQSWCVAVCLVRRKGKVLRPGPTTDALGVSCTRPCTQCNSAAATRWGCDMA